jgi:hypothetical protein
MVSRVERCSDAGDGLVSFFEYLDANRHIYDTISEHVYGLCDDEIAKATSHTPLVHWYQAFSRDESRYARWYNGPDGQA